MIKKNIFFNSAVHSTAFLHYATGKHIIRTTCKIAVDLDKNVYSELESQNIKPSRHPGITKTKHVTLPSNIVDALIRSVGDFPVKTLMNDCDRLNKYITCRHPPVERDEAQDKVDKIVEEIDKKLISQKKMTDDDNELGKKRDRAIRKVIGERIYAWKPLTYDNYRALVYAIGRSAQEYAIISKIFEEISQRDPVFKPRSFFDFGSGVGTGMWASSTMWKDSIFEYYNVDTSSDMHDLSDLLLRDGNENQQSTLRNVYYRQFLPASNTFYDLILTSYTLFELPSRQNRKEVILNLWRKCSGYLVIIEEGTRKGFELINEMREYLLKQKDENLRGSVFAPCPHDMACPRLIDINDKSPCNFEIAFTPLKMGGLHSERKIARYSYVVLKKGSIEDDSRNWPRLVRPTLVRSKHTICRMCTSKGHLQEIIFTQSKHGRPTYRCARASCWGDRMPIEIGEKYDNKTPVPNE